MNSEAISPIVNEILTPDQNFLEKLTQGTATEFDLINYLTGKNQRHDTGLFTGNWANDIGHDIQITRVVAKDTSVLEETPYFRAVYCLEQAQQAFNTRRAWGGTNPRGVSIDSAPYLADALARAKGWMKLAKDIEPNAVVEINPGLAVDIEKYTYTIRS